MVSKEGSRFSKNVMTKVKQFNARVEREKMEKEINELYRNLLKDQKKYERSLAPLVFPVLERERRKKEGFHFSEVSTPMSTQFKQSK